MKLNRKFTITILIFVMIPMGVILGVLFYNMEQSTIKEHRTYMKNKMERNKTQMETGISSINMATQFFISERVTVNLIILIILILYIIYIYIDTIANL